MTSTVQVYSSWYHFCMAIPPFSLGLPKGPGPVCPMVPHPVPGGQDGISLAYSPNPAHIFP